ncbi:hypothetical protein D3C78_1799860 [compost metagenome]
MADRDVLRRAHVDDLVLIHDPGVQFRSGGDAFHHGDRHRVLRIVQYGVNHLFSSLGLGRPPDAAGAERYVQEILWPRIRHVN